MPGFTTVLLISEEHAATNYQALLERVGYNVLLANDSAMASQIMTGIEIELVLLDYDQNDHNGWLKELRIQGRYRQTPVILLSQAQRPFDLGDDLYTIFMEKTRPSAQFINAIEQAVARFRR